MLQRRPARDRRRGVAAVPAATSAIALAAVAAAARGFADASGFVLLAAPSLRQHVSGTVHAQLTAAPAAAASTTQEAAGDARCGAAAAAVLVSGAVAVVAIFRVHARRRPYAVRDAGCLVPVRRGSRFVRQALHIDVVESSNSDPGQAVAEVVAKALAAVATSPPSFALVTVPPAWGSNLGTISSQVRAAGFLPANAPLVGLQSAAVGGLRLGLARADAGTAQPFFVNKEQLSQAGGGMAKENPVPGVPDGNHATVLLFADPKVPGSLTRNLLEALDARYPTAAKAGLVAMPVKAVDAEAAEELEWEPTKGDGRQLRTRDRSDGHGWVRGDPTFDACNESQMGEVIAGEFSRRPFGVKRYSPGLDGKGGMVMEMQEKERYKGDAMGQSAVKGVKTGMVVKSVGGVDVRGWAFEDLMDLLEDQGIMDPDAKSAASWGVGGQVQRQPVPKAELPVTIEYMVMSLGGGASLAPISLNGEPKKDGVLGVALPSPSVSSLDLVGCQALGPPLQVSSAGPSAEGGGGFTVNSLVVNGKAMPAGAALKGYASAAQIQSMKGMAVGIARPQAPGASGGNEASRWAVFPIAGLTKQGGLVLRLKSLAAEGLGSDQDLKQVQLFAPSAASLGAMAPGAGAIAFTTSADAAQSCPQAFVAVGAAVIGKAGADAASPAGTSLHRQAATILQ